jgi:thiamine pyrophosphate-dependent acetolactate synthase large subunit-like protein
MSARDALSVLVDVRDDSTVVVTNQGSARIWPQLAEHSLDFHYNPSTMGGAISFGLGLALAVPSRHVLVVSGDGALAMNLGALITVVAAKAMNLTVIVLDNGIYEVTGGQKTSASQAGVDYVKLAQSVGFRSAFGFDDAALWREQAKSALEASGPRLVTLSVDAALPGDLTTSLRPVAERLAQFCAAVTEAHSSQSRELSTPQ